MSAIAYQIADIQRRMTGLKAIRPVSISQIPVLEVSQSFSITLVPGAGAVIRATITCAGDPIADVGFGGHAAVGTGIIPANLQWTINGSVAIADCAVQNTAATNDTRTITITAWALNGLNATIERTS